MVKVMGLIKCVNFLLIRHPFKEYSNIKTISANNYSSWRSNYKVCLADFIFNFLLNSSAGKGNNTEAQVIFQVSQINLSRIK